MIANGQSPGPKPRHWGLNTLKPEPWAFRALVEGLAWPGLSRPGSAWPGAWSLALPITTPCPTQATHPNIKFWTTTDYNNWLLLPEAQWAQHGKEPHLEEVDGTSVLGCHLTSIHECIRGAWCKLVNMKRAPQVWGELDTMARDFFHAHIEKSWLLFRCAEGGWKLNRIAHSSYPAWCAGHIDQSGNWLTKAERKERKGRCKTEDDERPAPLAKVRRDKTPL